MGSPKQRRRASHTRTEEVMSEDKPPERICPSCRNIGYTASKDGSVHPCEEPECMKERAVQELMKPPEPYPNPIGASYAPGPFGASGISLAPMGMTGFMLKFSGR
jgi:hypothetical protein